MIQNPELFASAYNTIHSCEDLNMTERSVLTAIVSLMRYQNETIWCSISPTLTGLVGASKNTILRAKAELEAKGYLSVEDRGTDPKTGRRRPNAYSLEWALLEIDNPADATVGLPGLNLAPGPGPKMAPDIEKDMKEVEEKNSDVVVSNTSTNIAPMSSPILAPGPGLILAPGDDDDLGPLSFPHAYEAPGKTRSPLPRVPEALSRLAARAS